MALSEASIGKSVGGKIDRMDAMPHYVALIHKDAESCYGVSFPDWPGVVTAGDTIDQVMQQAVEVLSFAAEDRALPDGVKGIPKPRTIDELRGDPEFCDDAVHAVIVVVPFSPSTPDAVAN